MNGAVLKKIAVITMLIDHLGAAWIYIYTSWYAGREAFGGADVLYDLLRIIGRTAFPIFCFLLVEGFMHTKSVARYLLRLFMFALLSEVPFDLAFHNAMWDMRAQNVFFTLFWGLLSLWCFQYAEDRLEEKGNNWRVCSVAGYAGVFLCIGAAYAMQTDYDVSGVLLILLLYLFRTNRWMACLCGFVCMLYEAWCFPAFLCIMKYNGERGKGGKYFFYFFYPVHLLLLTGCRMLCM